MKKKCWFNIKLFIIVIWTFNFINESIYVRLKSQSGWRLRFMYTISSIDLECIFSHTLYGLVSADWKPTQNILVGNKLCRSTCFCLLRCSCSAKLFSLLRNTFDPIFIFLKLVYNLIEEVSRHCILPLKGKKVLRIWERKILHVWKVEMHILIMVRKILKKYTVQWNLQPKYSETLQF